MSEGQQTKTRYESLILWSMSAINLVTEVTAIK